MPHGPEYRAGSHDDEPSLDIRLSPKELEIVKETLADASEALAKRLEGLKDPETLELEAQGSTPEAYLKEYQDRHEAIEGLSRRLASR